MEELLGYDFSCGLDVHYAAEYFLVDVRALDQIGDATKSISPSGKNSLIKPFASS